MRREIGVGAAAIVALSVVPVVGLIAPLLGGGFAGWNSRRSPERAAVAGAGAAALASAASLPLLVVATAFVASTAVPAAVVLVATAIAASLYTVSLGALGGYAGRTLSADATDGVGRIRDQYLAGELTDTELERRLDALFDEASGEYGSSDDATELERR